MFGRIGSYVIIGNGVSRRLTLRDSLAGRNFVRGMLLDLLDSLMMP